MSIGPVSGNGIAVTLPAGKMMFWSVLVQAAYDQFIQLKDSSGNVIFTAQGSSSSGGTPTAIAQGIFQAVDPTNNYTVWIGTNGGSVWSKVLYSQDAIAIGSSQYLGKYIFASEDSTDNDYNDSYLQLQWFEYLG